MKPRVLRIAGNALVGSVCVVVAWATLGCDSSPAAPELEPCALVLVSALTGDTTRIQDYDGPPVENLFDLASVWWEGDCPDG